MLKKKKKSQGFGLLLETPDSLIFSLDFHLLGSLIQRKKDYAISIHGPFVYVFLIHFSASHLIFDFLMLIEIISITNGCL